MIESILTALRLLGPKYYGDGVEQMVKAIAYQESDGVYRKQHNGGPAHGLWQFEKSGGVKGVMKYHSTKKDAMLLCAARGVEFDATAIHNAFLTDDILAAGFARLYLWTNPKPLPLDKNSCWQYYLDTWRPGRPHPHKWAASWDQALDCKYSTS